MADKLPPRPVNPNPANSYERSHPDNENGEGLHAHKKSGTDHPDAMEQAVKNRQTNKQINAEDVTNEQVKPA